MHADELSPIRVLHLGSPTGLYGAERWILALIRYLPAERVESWVGVIKDTPELEAPLCREAARIGIRTHEFHAPGKLSLPAIGQIREFIRKYRVEVLHTHGYKTDILGRLAVAGTPCKLLATPHGWNLDGDRKLKIYEALDRICFHFADAVAPLSPSMHQELSLRIGLHSKLHLISNGVDLSDLDSTNGPSEPLAGWRADGRVIIGYIGRLISLKRIDTLIEAFHALPLKTKHLCIIGEGPLRSRLESLVSDLGESNRVTFFGYRADRISLLKGFDLFVLPSETEGIPRCVMESMGAGIPVVASDIPGCRVLVQDGVTGALFRPGDVPGLITCIRNVIGDVNLRSSLVANARELVRSKFSAESMAASYVTLYERLASPRACPIGHALDSVSEQ